MFYTSSNRLCSIYSPFFLLPASPPQLSSLLSLPPSLSLSLLPLLPISPQHTKTRTMKIKMVATSSINSKILNPFHSISHEQQTHISQLLHAQMSNQQRHLCMHSRQVRSTTATFFSFLSRHTSCRECWMLVNSLLPTCSTTASRDCSTIKLPTVSETA